MARSSLEHAVRNSVATRMRLAQVPLARSEAVTAQTSIRLTSGDDTALVVGKGARLEVYTISAGGSTILPTITPVCVYSATMDSRIHDLGTLSVKGAHGVSTDYLLVLTGCSTVSILAWRAGSFVTSSVHSMGEAETSDIAHPFLTPKLAIHESGEAIAVLCGATLNKLGVIYTTGQRPTSLVFDLDHAGLYGVRDVALSGPATGISVLLVVDTCTADALTGEFRNKRKNTCGLAACPLPQQRGTGGLKVNTLSALEAVESPYAVTPMPSTEGGWAAVVTAHSGIAYVNSYSQPIFKRSQNCFSASLKFLPLEKQTVALFSGCTASGEASLGLVELVRHGISQTVNVSRLAVHVVDGDSLSMRRGSGTAANGFAVLTVRLRASLVRLVFVSHQHAPSELLLIPDSVFAFKASAAPAITVAEDDGSDVLPGFESSSDEEVVEAAPVVEEAEEVNGSLEAALDHLKQSGSRVLISVDSDGVNVGSSFSAAGGARSLSVLPASETSRCVLSAHGLQGSAGVNKHSSGAEFVLGAKMGVERALCVTHSGTALYATANDGQLLRVDITSGAIDGQLVFDCHDAHAVAEFGTDDDIVAVVSDTNITVLRRSTEENDEIVSCTELDVGKGSRSLVLPEGDVLVVFSDSGEVFEHPLTLEETVAVRRVELEAFSAISAFSVAGTVYYITGHADGSVKVWRGSKLITSYPSITLCPSTHDGKAPKTLPFEVAPVSDVALLYAGHTPSTVTASIVLLVCSSAGDVAAYRVDSAAHWWASACPALTRAELGVVPKASGKSVFREVLVAGAGRSVLIPGSEGPLSPSLLVSSGTRLEVVKVGTSDALIQNVLCAPSRVDRDTKYPSTAVLTLPSGTYTARMPEQSLLRNSPVTVFLDRGYASVDSVHHLPAFKEVEDLVALVVHSSILERGSVRRKYALVLATASAFHSGRTLVFTDRELAEDEASVLDVFDLDECNTGVIEGAHRRAEERCEVVRSACVASIQATFPSFFGSVQNVVESFSVTTTGKADVRNRLGTAEVRRREEEIRMARERMGVTYSDCTMPMIVLGTQYMGTSASQRKSVRGRLFLIAADRMTAENAWYDRQLASAGPDEALPPFKGENGEASIKLRVIHVDEGAVPAAGAVSAVAPLPMHNSVVVARGPTLCIYTIKEGLYFVPTAFKYSTVAPLSIRTLGEFIVVSDMHRSTQLYVYREGCGQRLSIVQEHTVVPYPTCGVASDFVLLNKNDVSDVLVLSADSLANLRALQVNVDDVVHNFARANHFRHHSDIRSPARLAIGGSARLRLQTKYSSARDAAAVGALFADFDGGVSAFVPVLSDSPRLERLLALVDGVAPVPGGIAPRAARATVRTRRFLDDSVGGILSAEGLLRFTVLDVPQQEALALVAGFTSRFAALTAISCLLNMVITF